MSVHCVNRAVLKWPEVKNFDTRVCEKNVWAPHRRTDVYVEWSKRFCLALIPALHKLTRTYKYHGTLSILRTEDEPMKTRSNAQDYQMVRERLCDS